jgi:ATP-dependent exoDNAse (exonuclease V) beta subunit
VNQAVEDVVGAAADEVLRYLLVLIAEEVLAAARARREDGRLEFHDLLVLTRDMLRRDAGARSTLHDRYTHLLLDEFQDTDPIQIELATLIAASIVGSPTAGWGDLDVDDGRLFFVGDPKQSIYRFRRADIELFLAARDRFGPDGTWARLTTNFRTVAPVLDWVNAYFASVMAEERPGQQPRYEALSAWRQGAPDTDHRPVLLGPHPDQSEGRAAHQEGRIDKRGHSGGRDQPERWPVLSEDGQWRPTALATSRSGAHRTSVPYLREALEARDLPAGATGTVYDAGGATPSPR